jgi:hypothetical protein
VLWGLQLLQKDPERRLTLAQLVQHEWTTSGGSQPLHLRPVADPKTVPRFLSLRSFHAASWLGS